MKTVFPNCGGRFFCALILIKVEQVKQKQYNELCCQVILGWDNRVMGYIPANIDTPLKRV